MLTKDKWEWCVFIRGKKNKGEIFYYQLKNPRDKRWCSAISTHSKNKQVAERIAKHAAAMRDAEVQGLRFTEHMSVISFVELFYDEDKSPWILDKRAHNANALQSDHVRATRSYFERCLKKKIGREFLLGDVTPIWLNQLQKSIRTSYPDLSPQTMNAVFASLTKPIKYAANQWIIAKDPTVGLEPYAPCRRTTGVFSDIEIRKLLSTEWDSSIGKLAFNLALCTGIRLGEVLALRKEDMECRVSGDKELFLIHVTHSWSKTHGLKCPKNGKPRIVPVPSRLWHDLDNHVSEHLAASNFIFSSTQSDQPMSDKILRAALFQALGKIGVPEEQCRQRNLRFHSTRHYFNSQMVTQIDNEVLRNVIGHSNPEMTEHYHHITDTELLMVQQTQEKLFLSSEFLVEGATA